MHRKRSIHSVAIAALTAGVGATGVVVQHADRTLVEHDHALDRPYGHAKIELSPTSPSRASMPG